MKFQSLRFFAAFLCACVFASACVKKENKNLVIKSGGRDPRVDNFFNAVGLPLKTMNGNDIDSITADLSRVSPLFTNGLPPKNLDNPYSAPFFTLAQNVGTYFASQIWKTQITSTEDVRFFDLGANVDDGSGIQYKDTDFDLPVVLLNAYEKPDPKNYLGSVFRGVYVKSQQLTGEAQDRLLSHFYIMEYKLRDENGSRASRNVRTYYALVSVPVVSPAGNQVQAQQYRLIMYGHGGDYGTSSYELITVFNEKLKDFVVVAPLFPGEPLCTQISVQGKGCVRLDENNNLVKDNVGPYNSLDSDIRVPFNSIVPVAYYRSPLIEDINSFLGAHNAVARVMNLPPEELGGVHQQQAKLSGQRGKLNPFYSKTFPNHSVLIALEHTEEFINIPQQPEDSLINPDQNGAYMIPPGHLSPQTIGVGSSRGGSVVISAIGRMGFLMNMISSPLLPSGNVQFPHTVQDENGDSFQFQYPLFSSAALFFSPASFLTGKLRLLSIMVMQNELEPIAALPMAIDLAKNSFFTNYRNDSNYLSEIQSPVLGADGNLESAQDTLSQLATFIASNDLTFLAPFVATALQNWNSFYFEKNTRAPSSMILLHGSQDLVVPMSESTIAAQAMNTVWAGLYDTSFDPYGTYLTKGQFESMNESLKMSLIPGVGVAQYTFQPTDQFFNVPCDRKMLASIQAPNVIYNTNVGRCFGGGYSSKADGTNVLGSFHGHMDASFFTSRLVNTLPEDNLPLAVLSSNVMTNSQSKYYTMDYDGTYHMKHGRPKYVDDATCEDGDNCSFLHTLLLNSPTFMRYMSAEGMLDKDVVVAKKQIFQGEFKPHNNSALRPHDVFFTWLDSVACDLCEVKNENGQSLFPAHFGVFHDFTEE